MAVFFLKTGSGEKGPLTKSELLASLRAGHVSESATYRAAGDEAWRPVTELLSPGEGAAALRPRPNWGRQAIAGAVIFALVGAPWLWRRLERRQALGRSCRAAGDCPAQTSCMIRIDEQRNVVGAGYCTIACDDDTDCGSGMTCAPTVEVGPQGPRWDGMMGRSRMSCTKLEVAR